MELDEIIGSKDFSLFNGNVYETMLDELTSLHRMKLRCMTNLGVSWLKHEGGGRKMEK